MEGSRLGGMASRERRLPFPEDIPLLIRRNAIWIKSGARILFLDARRVFGVNCQLRSFNAQSTMEAKSEFSRETQLTSQPKGHMLANLNVWSPDGEWIVYDTRRRDDVFDGTRIERVHRVTGEVRLVYESAHGASCGVATWHPRQPQVVFIHGPENPTADWFYTSYHRRGVLVDGSGKAMNLDACDISPPFTPGALRGGSHVHVFSPDGERVSFTYEDHVLAGVQQETAEQEMNLRNVGVSIPNRPVKVSPDHPRNHPGTAFTVLVTRTVASPKPGSDEISRAFEEGWVGTRGYRRADDSWQRYALAFQGLVSTQAGARISEVFLVDLPEDLSRPGDGPLEGTERRRPRPPHGVSQRRLTFTEDRKFPGLQGPRHWLRSSPDGNRIAFCMKDDYERVQLWTLSPLGKDLRQVTRLPYSVASAFSWSPDGRAIAFAADQSIHLADVETGRCQRLTAPSAVPDSPLPFACVFSPDGKSIVYLRPISFRHEAYNQIFICDVSH